MKTDQVDQRELVITRVFDAPLELVWKQWSESERLMCWWVPKGLSWPHRRIELRVGGTYLYCMRSSDGKDFWSTGAYRETDMPSGSSAPFTGEKENVIRASYYGMQGDWPLELLVTVSFEEHAGKTLFSLRHAGIPPGQMFESTETIWSELLDKFAENLKKDIRIPETVKKEVIMTRVFDAPCELVYKAYTDPKLIPQWWGTKSFKTTVDQMEPRPGGVLRFVQRDTSGNEYAFNRVYREIVPHQRLVYTFVLESMPGHILLETVSFEEQGGKTKMTDYLVYQTSHPELAHPVAVLREGTAESMERFERLLSELKNRNDYGKDNYGRD
jgi:uncharacterized protein YndB with AHSA1/START domain